ncbi:unnamed protein product [Chrysodeixis includens]|uniref:Uncharacterized protein n=1 Tax=Chrysodeixis includens TaxID=689277 RepID=A0A9P0BG97_CHRIL|nr:unnamed protein product [Chrysodeixis includens]
MPDSYRLKPPGVFSHMRAGPWESEFFRSPALVLARCVRASPHAQGGEVSPNPGWGREAIDTFASSNAVNARSRRAPNNNLSACGCSLIRARNHQDTMWDIRIYMDKETNDDEGTASQQQQQHQQQQQGPKRKNRRCVQIVQKKPKSKDTNAIYGEYIACEMENIQNDFDASRAKECIAAIISRAKAGCLGKKLVAKIIDYEPSGPAEQDLPGPSNAPKVTIEARTAQNDDKEQDDESNDEPLHFDTDSDDTKEKDVGVQEKENTNHDKFKFYRMKCNK